MAGETAASLFAYEAAVCGCPACLGLRTSERGVILQATRAPRGEDGRALWDERPLSFPPLFGSATVGCTAAVPATDVHLPKRDAIRAAEPAAGPPVSGGGDGKLLAAKPRRPRRRKARKDAIRRTLRAAVASAEATLVEALQPGRAAAPRPASERRRKKAAADDGAAPQLAPSISMAALRARESAVPFSSTASSRTRARPATLPTVSPRKSPLASAWASKRLRGKGAEYYRNDGPHVRVKAKPPALTGADAERQRARLQLQQRRRLTAALAARLRKEGALLQSAARQLQRAWRRYVGERKRARLARARYAMSVGRLAVSWRRRVRQRAERKAEAAAQAQAAQAALALRLETEGEALHAAATRLQAAFRGWRVRRQLTLRHNMMLLGCVLQLQRWVRRWLAAREVMWRRLQRYGGWLQDVAVVWHRRRGHVRVPDGFTLLPTDLNSKTGGPHLFICVRIAPRAAVAASARAAPSPAPSAAPSASASALSLSGGAGAGAGVRDGVRDGHRSSVAEASRAGRQLPVTHITALRAPPEGGLPDVPAGWQLVAGNLNEGTSGVPTYLAVRRSLCAPLEALTVLSGFKRWPAPEGFSRLDVDLNKWAGGKYVFLAYKRMNIMDASRAMQEHVLSSVRSAIRSRRLPHLRVALARCDALFAGGRGYAEVRTAHQLMDKLLAGEDSAHEPTEEEQADAAAVIQAVWRGYTARRQLAKAHSAAHAIQAAWRGYAARQRYIHLLHDYRRHLAAIKLQATFRGHSERRRIAVKHAAAADRAARRLQRWMRNVMKALRARAADAEARAAAEHAATRASMKRSSHAGRSARPRYKKSRRSLAIGRRSIAAATGLRSPSSTTTSPSSAAASGSGTAFFPASLATAAGAEAAEEGGAAVEITPTRLAAESRRKRELEMAALKSGLTVGRGGQVRRLDATRVSSGEMVALELLLADSAAAAAEEKSSSDSSLAVTLKPLAALGDDDEHHLAARRRYGRRRGAGGEDRHADDGDDDDDDEEDSLSTASAALLRLRMAADKKLAMQRAEDMRILAAVTATSSVS